MKDLIVSVADGCQEKVMEALLPRVPDSSGIRHFSFDIISNPAKDSGSYNESYEFLRWAITSYKYALVLFDYEGSGIENERTREEAESDVEHLLSINGWTDRNAGIVIKPELENWMWIDNPHVQDAIGWEEHESLYSWAKSKGMITLDESKPFRPKECFEKALRLCGTSISSAIYRKIAGKVSYNRCKDPAFLKLISKLKEWFPI